MTATEHQDTQLAWAALAARVLPEQPPALDLELLAQFAEGRCDAPQRARVLALLADNPEAWAIWKSLLANIADQASAKAVPARESRWQRWFSPALLPRWGAGLATTCLAVMLGMQFMSSPTPQLPSLPPLAMTLLDSLPTGVPLASSPYVRTARTGFPRPPAADDDDTFRAGFLRGQAAAAARLGVDSPEWRAAAETLDQRRPQNCDQGECGPAHAAGIDFGVWASHTALRCAANPSAQAGTELNALRAHGTALPASLPPIPDDVELACNYAARLMWRYGETL